MKKSTLITTIAMIVVVVVALSTATYAWFSSSTTTSVSGEITTTAASDWVIMGGTRTTSGAGLDTVTYSSTTPISLILMSGLYSPTAVMTAKPSSATNSATFQGTSFFHAFQVGNGQLEVAQADGVPTYDPIAEQTPISSAVNYVRVINTKTGNDSDQALYLTVTVITDGSTDADYYAANGLSTYVAWKTATAEGSANTDYYTGTVDSSATTGEGEGYYAATRSTKATKSANLEYLDDIDAHNTGAKALPGTSYVDAASTPVTIGGEVISTGKYYQFVITIADAEHPIASNAAVNVAFYAWFDGWVVDNTAANANATVYFEFGANKPSARS